jgi:hypothetical protein
MCDFYCSRTEIFFKVVNGMWTTMVHKWFQMTTEGEMACELTIFAFPKLRNFYSYHFPPFYYTISLLQDYKNNLHSPNYNVKSYIILYTSCRIISQWIFSNHMFTYLWIDSSDNLFVKSVVLNLFSLLRSPSSRNVDAISFWVCYYFVSVFDAEFCSFFSNCWYL